MTNQELKNKFKSMKMNLFTSYLVMSRYVEEMKADRTFESEYTLYHETLGAAEALRELINDCGLSDEYKTYRKEGYITWDGERPKD